MSMTDESTANTLIWSNEHRAYWRVNAAGYTVDPTQAGIWPYAEAERMTRHCGPEKQIQLRLRHEVPEVILAAQRRAAGYVAALLELVAALPPLPLDWPSGAVPLAMRKALDAYEEAKANWTAP
jgi:hypothetical protein